MWVTIISDGVSIATQSLLSRYLAQNTEHGNQMSHLVIRRSFQIGLGLSSALALFLYSCRGPVVSLLTKRPDIQAAALHAFPVFLLAQGACFFVLGSIINTLTWLQTVPFLRPVSSLVLFSRQGIRLSGQRCDYGWHGLGRCHVVHVLRKPRLFCLGTVRGA